jgi:hypothetical protein
MKLLGCGCRPAVALVAAVALVNISSIHSFGIGGEPVSLLTASSSANGCTKQPINRRDGGRRAMIGEMLLLTTTTGLVLANPRAADAAALLTAKKADDAMSTINVWLDRLETIPVFCIVDQTSGANYMLVKQDQGMAIGYAFTTFAGALTVLSEAQKTAQEKNYYDVWENATVTTIPMSIAIRLALKKRVRTTPKEQTLDSIVLMIPGVVSEYMICCCCRCCCYSCFGLVGGAQRLSRQRMFMRSTAFPHHILFPSHHATVAMYKTMTINRTNSKME